MHLKIGLQHHIYISNGQIARDLLDLRLVATSLEAEKSVAHPFLRSNIYSDRPSSVVSSILSQNMRSLNMDYGPQWRVSLFSVLLISWKLNLLTPVNVQSARKNFANLLTAAKCDTYTPIQEREAIVALHDI